MNTPTRLAAFALVLAATFGIGAVLGNAVGPIDVDGGPHTSDPHTDTHADPGS